MTLPPRLGAPPPLRCVTVTKQVIERRCEWCGRRFDVAAGATGRPRKYCRQACRQRDYEARRRAAELGLTESELDGVATFYNLVFRRPVGRHVILFCDSVSCWIMGCLDVCSQLSRKLGVQPGGTTSDDRFTLLPIACLGACDHAPTMMVDGDLHRDLTPERLDAILERYP